MSRRLPKIPMAMASWDFDETRRFHTNPGDPDTDQDGVKDKADIRASVFDSKHGYALGHPEGRDFDGDGQPMELDQDADGGGCFDGQEDGNGQRQIRGQCPGDGQL